MPPSMSDNENDDITPPLTDEDVNLLHGIVLRAQELPGKPFEALSQAYDEKLKKRGPDRDPDGRYIRFLMRMQDGVREGVDLPHQFKDTLDGMGIQVDWDDEDEGIQDITRNLNIGPSDGRVASQYVPRLPRHPDAAESTRSRRASFDSYLDNTLDNVPGVDSGALDFGGNRRSRSAELSSELPLRRRTNGTRGRRSVSNTPASNHRRSFSASSHGTMELHRNDHANYQSSVGYSGDESEHTDSLDHGFIQIPGVNAPIPELGSDRRLDYGRGQQPIGPLGLNQPITANMTEDAQAFDTQRMRSAVRRYFGKWRSQTQDRLSKLDEMNAKANAHYHRTLCKASLETLGTVLEKRRTAAETERFYNRLERGAASARDLFVITKAFTHWEEHTRDEIERASTARRHMVRTRYFKAWRAVTAVNQLKIRQFVLGKTIRMWRTRLATLRERDQLAVVWYEKNRDRRILLEWKSSCLENQAHRFDANRLRRSMLNRWMEKIRALGERNAHIGRMWDSNVLRKAMKKMGEKVVKQHEQEIKVEIFRRQALLGTGFKMIQTRSKLQPLSVQFTQRWNQRTLQSVFQAWHHTAQLSRKARTVDRERILRNAWTAWNDQLRIRSLKVKITDRFAVECLYKWALASRISLFTRVKVRHLKESKFATWVGKIRDRQAALNDAEQRFAQFKRTQLLRTHLRKIEAATVVLKGKEFIARSFLEPRVKQRMFNKLLDQHDHLQRLNQLSENCCFYIQTTHALKAWKDASQTARRNKRREAYTHMRRIMKLNLVRRKFGIWRDRMAQMQVAERQANEMVENRTLRVTTEKLAIWHHRTVFLQGRNLQAMDLLATKLTSFHLVKWHQRLEFVQTLDTQAVALRQENTEILAASYLKKKLGWRIWNIQRQHTNAEALFQRNFDKHMRAMIRFWAEQTAERLAARQASPTPSRRSRRSRRDDGENGENIDMDTGIEYGEPTEKLDADKVGDETRRLEAWTAFDEGALGLSNLDLSLSLSPHHQPSTSKSIIPPMASQQHPPSASRSSAPQSRNPIPTPRSVPRPTITRTPFSNRRPPSTIPELTEPDMDAESYLHPHPRPQPTPTPNLNLNPETDIEEDLDFELDQGTFWASTPAPNTFLQAYKPGYLKTPSKRSVARAKRPGLGNSPEKQERGGSGVVGGDVGAIRGLSIGGRGSTDGLQMGARTAPAKIAAREVEGGVGVGGVTSFERRLREGGFGFRGRGRGGAGRKVG
ncbi:Sfi1-domain-containing protein [Amniculicola lignicola CBS 123094]|uniref:Sfi1-domain-containing protein n=1 Tax=Amniculicola lignicola CBS 123094 TaxID=1392246 RepID=A0A6A5VZ21_9PLEO|nr:Sfi1-domain-containing protein [Amniculicola lignicola CBS 123094]